MKIEIPCSVGDTIYFLDDKTVIEGRKKVNKSFVNKGTVDHITLGQPMIPILTVCDDKNCWIDFDTSTDLGVIAFMKSEEADQALIKEIELNV